MSAVSNSWHMALFKCQRLIKLIVTFYYCYYSYFCNHSCCYWKCILGELGRWPGALLWLLQRILFPASTYSYYYPITVLNFCSSRIQHGHLHSCVYVPTYTQFKAKVMHFSAMSKEPLVIQNWLANVISQAWDSRVYALVLTPTPSKET